jgi:hypothetical protein
MRGVIQSRSPGSGEIASLSLGLSRYHPFTRRLHIPFSTGSGTDPGCTLVNNHSLGGYYPAIFVDGELEGVDIAIDRTIIAFNIGPALYCEYGSQVTVQCCDLHGNTEGDDLCGEDLGGNFSADPLFCGAEEGDYSLDGYSPCLPGNHPDGVDCGLIGALGQGCGATPVEETSWGRVKALYRR